MSHTIDDETRQMIEMFVAESIDALDSSENLVEDLAIEGAMESINTIFRVFHTIKGLSGFVNFPVLHSATHEAETLLDIFRKNPSSVDESIISSIYSIFDFLRLALNSIGSTYSEEQYQAQADEIIISIRSTIASLKGSSDPEEAEDNPVEKEVKKNISEEKKDDSSAKHRTSRLFISAQEKLRDVLQSPKEKAVHVHEIVSDLRRNFSLIEDQNLKDYWDNVENLSEAVSGGALVFDEAIFTIISSDLSIIHHMIEAKPEIIIVADENETVQENPSIEENEHLSSELKEENFARDGKPEKKKNSPETNIIAKSEKKIPEQTQRSDIRVQTEKLDRLFDLVGELITLQSMVINNPDLDGLELPNFTKSCGMLDKVTRELQEVTMSIRMTPLEALFNKMKRLVRDTAIKMEKKISFHISGQETEMDKNIIEEIADPLMHLLRNSIDHGVEFPGQRITNGKEETGNIWLSARYEANQIRIDIEDDGAGINKEKILAKAQQAGVLKTAPEKMSSREIFALIFEPGLSTAEKITAVSGRGVGMDVVRKNIEKLQGTIQVESEEGKGTKMILRIPLTLAIMDAMLIGVGESRYAVPMLLIRESFRPKKDDITITMDGLEVVRVRDELFPVVRLHELFSLVPKISQLDEGILMIVEVSGERACLFVDEIIGQQQAVVKGLSDYIGKVGGVTGCMILGNGEIGLILDVENIIKLAREEKFHRFGEEKNSF